MLKGRTFNESDVGSSLNIAVVNDALARTVFPGQDPIGKQLTNFGPDNLTLQIIGVVGNVRHVGLDEDPHSEIYQLLGQAQWPSMFVAIRSATSDPTSVTSAAQNAVWSVNKDVPLASVRTMQDLIANSVQRRKFSMFLLSIFAAVAMLLAAIGLYGVMSYSVAQRTHEIGIRMALGARRPDVLALVVKQGMTLALMGIAAGATLALAMTRLIAGMLFGITATDPLTFAGVAALLGDCGVPRELPASSPRFEGRSHGGFAIRVESDGLHCRRNFLVGRVGPEFRRPSSVQRVATWKLFLPAAASLARSLSGGAPQFPGDPYL